MPDEIWTLPGGQRVLVGDVEIENVSSGDKTTFRVTRTMRFLRDGERLSGKTIPDPDTNCPTCGRPGTGVYSHSHAKEAAPKRTAS